MQHKSNINGFIMEIIFEIKLSQIYPVLKHWDDAEINISTSSKPVVIRENCLAA